MSTDNEIIRPEVAISTLKKGQVAAVGFNTVSTVGELENLLGNIGLPNFFKRESAEDFMKAHGIMLVVTTPRFTADMNLQMWFQIPNKPELGTTLKNRWLANARKLGRQVIAFSTIPAGTKDIRCLWVNGTTNKAIHLTVFDNGFKLVRPQLIRHEGEISGPALPN